MSNGTPSSTYLQVVKITNVYLGPAADRFIARQVESHLKKDPSQLSVDDLLNLIDWLKISISMLTEDKDIVEEYISELYKLANKSENRFRRD